MSPQCSNTKDLWLQMIEGNDDQDDVWLWADGDEEWIRKNVKWPDWLDLREEEWVSARAALNRRIARHASRPNSNSISSSISQHQVKSARLREATPAQRVAAIYWLICTSKRKEEVDHQLGWSSRSNFRLDDLLWKWHADVSYLLGSFPRFPGQPEAWQKFEEKRNAMECRCLGLQLLSDPVPDWFRMATWLGEENGLDMVCLDADACEACKSR